MLKLKRLITFLVHHWLNLKPSHYTNPTVAVSIQLVKDFSSVTALLFAFTIEPSHIVSYRLEIMTFLASLDIFKVWLGYFRFRL